MHTYTPAPQISCEHEVHRLVFAIAVAVAFVVAMPNANASGPKPVPNPGPQKLKRGDDLPSWAAELLNGAEAQRIAVQDIDRAARFEPAPATGAPSEAVPDDPIAATLAIEDAAAQLAESCRAIKQLPGGAELARTLGTFLELARARVAGEQPDSLTPEATARLLAAAQAQIDNARKALRRGTGAIDAAAMERELDYAQRQLDRASAAGH